VPGYPDAVIDLVPVDYVAEASVALTFDKRALGGCFHLCAGPKRDSTLGEIAQFASTFFKVPPPRYISPKLFFALIRPFLYATVWGKNRRYLRELRAYRPYFLVRTIFDHRGAGEYLEPAGIQPPAVSDYLEKLFRYCLSSDWGSRSSSTHNES
jgi:hypothetical protein